MSTYSKRNAGISVTLIVCLVAMASHALSKPPATQRIVLEDSQGRARLILGRLADPVYPSSNDPFGMRAVDSAGRQQMLAVFGSNSSAEATRVTLYSPDGSSQIELEVGAKTMLRVGRPNGPHCLLEVQGEGAQLVLDNAVPAGSPSADNVKAIVPQVVLKGNGGKELIVGGDQWGGVGFRAWQDAGSLSSSHISLVLDASGDGRLVLVGDPTKGVVAGMGSSKDGSTLELFGKDGKSAFKAP